MSRILIVAAVFPPEPVVSARIAYELALSLSSNNEVTVLCPKPSRPYGFNFNADNHVDSSFTRLEIKSFVCPYTSFWGRMRESISFGLKTSRFLYLNKSNIDCIYADTWPFFAQFILVYTALKCKKPITIHVQDIYPESFTNKLKYFKKVINYLLIPVDKFILNNAKSVVAISSNMKQYLIETRLLPSNKIAIVLNWQDPEKFIINKISNTSDNVFTFMYLGNIGPVAGIDLLIDAYSQANLKNSRLIIAGSGSMKSMLMQKAKNCTSSDIQFWSVPDGHVADIQSKANILLLPIKKGAALSSIPSKLPAYMLSSKPILCCTDFDSDTAKCIIESDCGIVVESENVALLSDRMIKMYTQSSSDLERMGVNGFNYAQVHFSKKINLDKLNNIVLDSLNN